MEDLHESAQSPHRADVKRDDGDAAIAVVSVASDVAEVEMGGEGEGGIDESTREGVNSEPMPAEPLVCDLTST